MTKRAIIITGCNHKFFNLAEDLVDSLYAVGMPEDVDIGCFDFGLTQSQIIAFTSKNVLVLKPECHLIHDLAKHEEKQKMAYIARLFMREVAPGYEVYIWLDADTWVQTPSAIPHLIATADENGSAFIHERVKQYGFSLGLEAWRFKHFSRGYGVASAVRLQFVRHINVGVFALHVKAPHWEAWKKSAEEGVARSRDFYPYDQFGLNHAVWIKSVPSYFIDPTFNWIVDHSQPVFDLKSGLLCTPEKAPRPIQIVHLAGPLFIKEGIHKLKTTSGGSIERRLGFRH